MDNLTLTNREDEVPPALTDEEPSDTFLHFQIFLIFFLPILPFHCVAKRPWTHLQCYALDGNLH